MQNFMEPSRFSRECGNLSAPIVCDLFLGRSTVIAKRYSQPSKRM